MGPRGREVPEALCVYFALSSANSVAGPACRELGTGMPQKRGGGTVETLLLINFISGWPWYQAMKFSLRNSIDADQISCLHSHYFSALECLLRPFLIFQLLIF